MKPATIRLLIFIAFGLQVNIYLVTSHGNVTKQGVALNRRTPLLVAVSIKYDHYMTQKMLALRRMWQR